MGTERDGFKGLAGPWLKLVTEGGAKDCKENLYAKWCCHYHLHNQKM